MHIVLVDDHLLFLEGLKSVLEKQEDIEEVTIFDGTDIDVIHRYLYKHTVDLVLMDIHLSHQTSGLKLGKQLKNRLPFITLVFLTGHDYPEYRRLASGAGAKAYLSKSLNPIDLAEKLRIVAGGGELSITDSASQEILKEEELETLQLICEGTQNKEIARMLNISERGVEYRIQNIKNKLQAATIQEAILKAVKLGLVRMHT